MSEQQQPTPEQQADAVRAQVLACAPANLDLWRLSLEQLDGYIAAAMQRGWPEFLARQLVAAEFIARMRA